MSRVADQIHLPVGSVLASDNACVYRAIKKSADRVLREHTPTILLPDTPGTMRMISNWPFGE